MSEELKPCPFCGQPVEFGWFNMEANIACTKADCAGNSGVSECAFSLDEAEKVKAKVIARWNTRAAPKVKPLVWGDYNGHATAEMTGSGVFGRYFIDREIKGFTLSLRSEKVGTFGTTAAAKAAAQADYETRILSALEGMK